MQSGKYVGCNLKLRVDTKNIDTNKKENSFLLSPGALKRS